MIGERRVRSGGDSRPTVPTIAIREREVQRRNALCAPEVRVRAGVEQQRPRSRGSSTRTSQCSAGVPYVPSAFTSAPAASRARTAPASRFMAASASVA